MWNDECRGPSPGFLLIIFFYKLVSEDGYLHQLALEEMNPKKDDKEKDKEKLVHFCICKIIINCRSYTGSASIVVLSLEVGIIFFYSLQVFRSPPKNPHCKNKANWGYGTI